MDDEMFKKIRKHLPRDYMPQMPISDDLKNQIMTDEKFASLTRFIATYARMRTDGTEGHPPVLLVAGDLPDEMLDEAKEKFCDDQGIHPWQFESALEENNTEFQPVGVVLPDREGWEKNRHYWVWKTGRDWKEQTGVFPRAMMIVAETWYIEPNLDPDDPDRTITDPTAEGYILPSEHPDRKEALLVAGQTLDQRTTVVMMPIDRDPDGNMLVGPPMPMWKSANIVHTEFVNYLGQQFWRGFFYSMLGGKEDEMNEDDIPTLGGDEGTDFLADNRH